jgi:hypothetical protein
MVALAPEDVHEIRAAVRTGEVEVDEDDIQGPRRLFAVELG